MITIAIPTYNRGAILVETIERLLDLQPRAAAIIIADQTVDHPPEVEARLREWSDSGAIRWLRLAEPSIPRAMNDALIAAGTPLVERGMEPADLTVQVPSLEDAYLALTGGPDPDGAS